ncbi:MAG TPA: L,D-transpeptidase [Solirubrobacteraceae bacterium]|nr:L,D-transpeptidase [Solirubrobacteraceae bacterium]
MKHRAGTRRRRALVGLLSATALSAALAGPNLAAAQDSAGAVLTRLSDLHAVSRWAYPASAALIRSSPSARAHALGRLRFLTGDGQAELYLALASERLASGQTWIRVELPARPNGRTGWVPSEALGSLHAVNGFLLIDRRRLRATLFRDGRAIFGAPVGVGEPSTVTPSGHFYVMEKLTTLRAPFYGPYAIGTSAYAPTLSEWPGGGVVGIHGTDEPQLIPGRPSHGCIRMRNPDIVRLWAKIALGTPIEIT